MLAQRAAHDPDRGLLRLADAHIGKAVSFRRLGVPVPCGTTQQALLRLDQLLAATDARQIAFLGDLLHLVRAQRSAALDAMLAWRQRHAACACRAFTSGPGRRCCRPFGAFTGLRLLPRQGGDPVFAVLDTDPPSVLPLQ